MQHSKEASSVQAPKVDKKALKMATAGGPRLIALTGFLPFGHYCFFRVEKDF